MPEHLEPEEGERLAGGLRWVEGSLPEDYEPPDVLVTVTARESDALEHVHMLLSGQRRHKLADAIGELLLRIRERQDIPVEIHEGIPEKTPSDPLDDLRQGRWEEDWERW
jgi:hypothetical protein